MQFSSIFHNITVRLFSTFDRRYHNRSVSTNFELHMVHSLILTNIYIYVSFTQRLLAASIALPVQSNGYGKGSDVCVSRLDVR